MRFPLVVMLAAVSASANAQTMNMGRAAIAADSVPSSVQLAEAQGARFALAPAPELSQYTLLTAQYPGTSDHRCVEAGEAFRIRSGDFTVAGFSVYRGVWHAGWGKLNWMPYHPQPANPGQLIVRATRLDDPTKQWIFEREGGMAHAPGANLDYSYPSAFYLPSPGRWMLVATAGTNWGCFIYNLA
jgi:hypothetical protein